MDVIVDEMIQFRKQKFNFSRIILNILIIIQFEILKLEDEKFHFRISNRKNDELQWKNYKLKRHRT